MKKEELEIIKKVIEEEGMRRDIGLLLGKNPGAAVKPSSFQAAGKWLLLLVGLGVLIGSAYFYTRSEKEEVSQFSKTNVKEIEGVVNEKTEASSLTELSESDSKDTKDNDLTPEVLSEKVITQSGEPNTKDWVASKTSEVSTIEGEVFNEPKVLVKKRELKASKLEKNKKVQVYSKKEVNDNKANSIAAISNSSTKTKEAINIIGQPNNDSSQNKAAKDAEAIVAKDKEQTEDSSLAKEVLSQINKGNESEDTNSNEKPVRKWDIMVGGGYGFMSTGDIPTIVLGGAASRKLTKKFSASIAASYGQYSGGALLETAYFKQLEANILFSPFKNTRKSDFRLGVGPTYYSASRSYRGSSYFVNGMVMHDYIYEKKNSFGLNVNLDYRYQIGSKFLVGANVYTQQYFNKDIVSGFIIKAGFLF